MVAFYERYISPSSPQCTSITVNVRSQISVTTEPHQEFLGAKDDGSIDSEDIKKLIRDKFKVNEAELDDGVELWRQIHVQVQDAKVNGAENSEMIEVEKSCAFKAELTGIDSRRRFQPKEVTE
jgi:hypothetical protein